MARYLPFTYYKSYKERNTIMAGSDKKEQERNQRGTTNKRFHESGEQPRDNAREGQGDSEVDHKSRGHGPDGSEHNDPDNGTQGRNAADSRLYRSV